MGGSPFAVGIDVMTTDELRRLLKRNWFVHLIFDEAELSICDKWAPQRRVEFLSGRFAAKEAIFKAISQLGIQRVNFNKIVIGRDQLRRPLVSFSTVSEKLEGYQVSVSITHKANVCAAVALVRRKHSLESMHE